MTDSAGASRRGARITVDHLGPAAGLALAAAFGGEALAGAGAAAAAAAAGSGDAVRFFLCACARLRETAIQLGWGQGVQHCRYVCG